MCIESVNRWSLIGLAVGGVLAIGLLAADISFWIAVQTPALASPFHQLVVLLIALVVVSSVILLVGVWLARRQERILTELLARGVLPTAAADPDRDTQSAQVVQFGGRIARRILD